MTTSAALSYKCWLGGASAAQMTTLLESVSPPLDYLASIGVRVVSDSASGSNPVVLGVGLSLVPASDATATAVLRSPAATGSPIESVTVTAPGSGYVAPPIVSFTGGRPSTVDSPGFPETPIVVRDIAYAENTPASAQAYLKVVSAAVAAGGSSYTAPIAVITGRQRQNGTPAKLSFTVVGGVITGVAIVDAGSGYTEVPTVAVVDTTGSGASITLSMGVGEVLVLRGGSGFNSAPTVVLTPLFQALFPVGSDQAAPLRQLMTTALEQVTMGPISAAEPVIS